MPYGAGGPGPTDHDRPLTAAERRWNVRPARSQTAAAPSSTDPDLAEAACFALENRYPTGTVPASNHDERTTTVPGGMNARARFTYPIVCDNASDMSVPGWNVSFSREAF